MFCRYCGSQQGDARFCTACGRPLDELPRQAAVARPVEEMAGYRAASAPFPTYEAPLAPEYREPVRAALDTTPAATATNVTVNVAGPRIRFEDETGPGLIARAFWFLFIGWWAGFFWIGMAAFLNLTIVGLPLGFMMFNAVPKVMTLRSRNVRLSISQSPDGTYVLTRRHLEQRPLALRALYFLVVGWWLSILWAYAAYAIGLLIITLPVSFWMFDRMPALTTLARY